MNISKYNLLFNNKNSKIFISLITYNLNLINDKINFENINKYELKLMFINFIKNIITYAIIYEKENILKSLINDFTTIIIDYINISQEEKNKNTNYIPKLIDSYMFGLKKIHEKYFNNTKINIHLKNDSCKPNIFKYNNPLSNNNIKQKNSFTKLKLKNITKKKGISIKQKKTLINNQLNKLNKYPSYNNINIHVSQNINDYCSSIKNYNSSKHIFNNYNDIDNYTTYNFKNIIDSFEDEIQEYTLEKQELNDNIYSKNTNKIINNDSQIINTNITQYPNIYTNTCDNSVLVFNFEINTKLLIINYICNIYKNNLILVLNNYDKYINIKNLNNTNYNVNNKHKYYNFLLKYYNNNSYNIYNTEESNYILLNKIDNELNKYYEKNDSTKTNLFNDYIYNILKLNEYFMYIHFKIINNKLYINSNNKYNYVNYLNNNIYILYNTYNNIFNDIINKKKYQYMKNDLNFKVNKNNILFTIIFNNKNIDNNENFKSFIYTFFIINICNLHTLKNISDTLFIFNYNQYINNIIYDIEQKINNIILSNNININNNILEININDITKFINKLL